MLECDTRTETLRVGTPFTVGPITLLPIERVVRRRRAHAWFSLAKEPYMLVLRDTGGIRAVDTDTDADVNSVSLEQLREEVPGLDAVLASM